MGREPHAGVNHLLSCAPDRAIHPRFSKRKCRRGCLVCRAGEEEEEGGESSSPPRRILSKERCDAPAPLPRLVIPLPPAAGATNQSIPHHDFDGAVRRDREREKEGQESDRGCSTQHPLGSSTVIMMREKNPVPRLFICTVYFARKIHSIVCTIRASTKDSSLPDSYD